jgi:hypothetical protein
MNDSLSTPVSSPLALLDQLENKIEHALQSPQTVHVLSMRLFELARQQRTLGSRPQSMDTAMPAMVSSIFQDEGPAVALAHSDKLSPSAATTVTAPSKFRFWRRRIPETER